MFNFCLQERVEVGTSFLTGFDALVYGLKDVCVNLTISSILITALHDSVHPAFVARLSPRLNVVVDHRLELLFVLLDRSHRSFAVVGLNHRILAMFISGNFTHRVRVCNW